MTLQDLRDKKILLLGYAREGKSTEAFLRSRLSNPDIRHADESEDPNYLDAQDWADVVIRTPGIPLSKVRKPHTTATNLFFECVQNQVIGVTGSKGKSTTSSLIAAILSAAGKAVHLVGNIGNPALDALMSPVGPDDIFVMELSSYQCEDLEYSPHVSVITSLFPDHLDHHGGYEPYVAAKARILAKATDKDFYVFNPKYGRLAGLAKTTKAEALPYVGEISFDTSRIKLEGEHNLDNIRGALTVASIFGIPMNAAKSAIEKFQPLPHRLTFVGEFKGIKFYDDAIATAPEPTIFAIQTLKDVDTIFLGGTDRGYEFDDLAKVIGESGIRNVVLFPDTGSRIKEALSKNGVRLENVLETRSMEEAVRFAFEHTAPGKICLLSTASPSYSVWKNFEEKGDEFVKNIKSLS